MNSGRNTPQPIRKCVPTKAALRPMCLTMRLVPTQVAVSTTAPGKAISAGVKTS